MDVRRLRRIHRWLGVLAGIQLMLWTASGLFFALNPIERVRGETETAGVPGLDPTDPVLYPAAALETLAAGGELELASLTLRPHLGGAVWEIAYSTGDGGARWALADPGSGRLRPPVGAEEAAAIARWDFALEAEVVSVERVTDVGRGSEYRGGPLPAWRVVLDHRLGTRLYVSAERGRVTARRNHRWRVFDLLWMLHIMDWRGREDFNTWWLQLMSGMGLVTVVSGLVLAAATSPTLRRRSRSRRSRAAPHEPARP